MSRGQYRVGFEAAKKIGEAALKDEKIKTVIVSSIAAAIAFIGGIIAKAVSSK